MRAQRGLVFDSGGRGDRPGIAPSVGGPVVIVAAVLVVSHDVIASRVVHTQYTDVLGEWLPNLCYLGKALRAGHIPGWNPHVMAGIDFAGDPLHGWMNLPAMVLFAFPRCDLDLRAYMLLQPILAGLGMYAFLRAERTSRTAATVGGLALAVPIAGSSLIGSLYASGSIAWTALLLLAAARAMHSASWRPRLLWILAAAVAWGQVAATHTESLAYGTILVAAYLVARAATDIADGRLLWVDAVALGGALAIACALVNAAYFLPRFDVLHRTTLGLGYGELEQRAIALTGKGAGVFVMQVRFGWAWPLSLALVPGLFVGAAALVLAFGGWSSPPHRWIAIAFGTFGVASYVAAVQGVADAVAGTAPTSSVKSLYLHAPYRVGLDILIVVAVLAGFGVEGWREARSWGRRILVIGPGLAVWLLLPPLFGASARHLAVLWTGTVALVGALVLAKIRPALIWVVAAVAAAELIAGGLLGHVPILASRSRPRARAVLSPVFVWKRSPDIDLAAYVHPGPIAVALSRDGRGSRFVSVAPNLWTSRGYHVWQAQPNWPLMATQRSSIFGLEEAQGYNSDQLLRFWSFVRVVDPIGQRYAASFFRRPPPIALNLLGVGWVVGPRISPPVADASPAVTEGRWRLYRLHGAPPRASLVTRWRVIRDPEMVLRDVATGRVDPARSVIVERSPGITEATGGERSPLPTSVTYRSTGEQSALITVDAAVPSLVLVRNTYDPDWRATVDGRPAHVLAANYVDQAVAVGAGHHTIVLVYRQPAIVTGLVASGVAVVGLLVAAVGVEVIGRRRRRHAGVWEEPGTVAGATAASPSSA